MTFSIGSCSGKCNNRKLIILTFVAEKVDGFALLHMKTLRTDSKIFSRLGVCFGDAVRLLRIIDALTQNIREKPKPSLTTQKDFTPRTKSDYQSKYVWSLLIFSILKRSCARKNLILMMYIFTHK